MSLRFIPASESFLSNPLLLFLLLLLTLYAVPADAAPRPAPATMVRPYSGIGIINLHPGHTERDIAGPIHLYEEPGIRRLGVLHVETLPRYPQIFTGAGQTIPALVTARKGNWLRIAYDDAGREAWLQPPRKSPLLPWDSLLKGKKGLILPGLQPQHYSLHQDRGGLRSGTLAPRQRFRIISAEGDWILVLSDSSRLAWLRWRDEDGRLLIGIEL